MYRASPPRRVEAFSFTGATAAGAAPTGASDGVNLFRSTVRHEDGFAHGEYAIFPDQPQYEKLRFSFGTDATSVTSAAIVAWGIGSEDVPYVLGRSELGADGQFAPIEFDNHQAVYAVQLAEFSGTGSLSVDVFVQGVYVAPYSRG